MTGTLIGVAAGLVLVSAALTAVASAAFQVGNSRLRTLQEEGFQGAEALVDLRADGQHVEKGLSLVTQTLNLAVLGLVVGYASVTWGLVGGGVALAAGIVLVLLATDILPRMLVARHPIRLALVAAPTLRTLSRWLNLATAPVVKLEDALAGAGEDEVSSEERELREIQELGQAEGVIEEAETLLVERAFRLDELTAWDVMTPRVDIFAWRDSLTLEEIIGELATVPYSRVPVYGESVDDITGILYVREAYETFVEGSGTLPLSRLAREPFFVPGSLSLSRLMQDFQLRRIHMGIVADEFGGIDGLVTLEDVLEELVGEIVDETDIDEDAIVRVSRTEILVDAGIDLREINYAFNVSLPQLEHRSLNGYILEELGYVPQAGETIEREGVRVEIVEATETQVLRARLTRQPAELAERAEDDA